MSEILRKLGRRFLGEDGKWLLLRDGGAGGGVSAQNDEKFLFAIALLLEFSSRHEERSYGAELPKKDSKKHVLLEEVQRDAFWFAKHMMETTYDLTPKTYTSDSAPANKQGHPLTLLNPLQQTKKESVQQLFTEFNSILEKMTDGFLSSDKVLTNKSFSGEGNEFLQTLNVALESSVEYRIRERMFALVEDTAMFHYTFPSPIPSQNSHGFPNSSLFDRTFEVARQFVRDYEKIRESEKEKRETAASSRVSSSANVGLKSETSSSKLSSSFSSSQKGGSAFQSTTLQSAAIHRPIPVVEAGTHNPMSGKPFHQFSSNPSPSLWQKMFLPAYPVAARCPITPSFPCTNPYVLVDDRQRPITHSLRRKRKSAEAAKLEKLEKLRASGKKEDVFKLFLLKLRQLEESGGTRKAGNKTADDGRNSDQQSQKNKTPKGHKPNKNPSQTKSQNSLQKQLLTLAKPPIFVALLVITLQCASNPKNAPQFLAQLASKFTSKSLTLTKVTGTAVTTAVKTVGSALVAGKTAAGNAVHDARTEVYKRVIDYIFLYHTHVVMDKIWFSFLEGWLTPERQKQIEGTLAYAIRHLLQDEV